jgi:hypothetical protein
MRATPNSLCTKWVAMSDAMTDAEHAAEDAKLAEAKARAKYLHEHEAERKWLERLRDTAPMYRSNAPFSIFKQ